MRLPHRLGRELDAWQRDGLIGDEQRRAILARYEPAIAASELVSYTLMTLAILAAGTGVVVFLSWNWSVIPPLAKTSGAIAGVAVCYAAAAVKASRGKGAHAEWLSFFGALLSGGALLVGAEVVHADPDQTSITLLWSMVLASTAWLTASAITASAAGVVLLWWMVTTSGAPPVPWAFLLVWPILAATVERAKNRFAAGGVAIAFGVWAFFVTLAVWGEGGGSPAPAFVVALASGAWLDALSHADEKHRPAFARATPALVVVMLSLVWLLPSSVHREVRNWRDTLANPWPVFALVASLGVMTFRLGLSRRHRQWRPIGMSVVSIAWLTAWLVMPTTLLASGAFRWMWTAIFSGTMVWAGSMAVREASTTGDRGTLAVGVLGILAVVVIRAVDTGGGLVVQAPVLLAVSLLLAWLARTWSRQSTGTSP